MLVDFYLEPSLRDLKKGSKLRDLSRSFENKIIEEELKRAKGNKTEVSRRLGISRATLNNKLKEFYVTQKRA